MQTAEGVNVPYPPELCILSVCTMRWQRKNKTERTIYMRPSSEFISW